MPFAVWQFNEMANGTQEEMNSVTDWKPKPVNSWQMSPHLQGEKKTLRDSSSYAEDFIS